MASGWGYETRMAADGQEAIDKLETFPADVIVTDMMMPRVDGNGLLQHLRDAGLEIPAIVVTAFGNIETAVATIHDMGAFWFLEKPIQPRVLKLLLERALQQKKLVDHSVRLERQLSGQGMLVDLVGTTPAMQEIFALIQQVAPSRATVLITGESGTGKELVARAIHRLSPRRAAPFIPVNCAALPDTLIESELFGHEKGAFTGAVERRAGCFELAEHGTLLLDEIGEMPVSTQAKLLRVLEDRKVRRLGGSKEIEVDVRVLASTNRNLEDSIRKGEFREDLYYRLNVFQIALPPLRERRDDIPAMCRAMIQDLNIKHQCKVTDLDPQAATLLARHNWPGNARELRNAMERAVILTGEGTITVVQLPRGISGSAPRPVVSEETVQIPVGTTIDQAERELIELTLKHTRNNKTRAAEILGISLKTLFNKLKEYGAEPA